MATVLLDSRPETKLSLDKSFSWPDAYINCTLAVTEPSTDLGYRSPCQVR